MSNINFGFISELEGGATCKGYVPDGANSKSGVTIATGFDIGQRSTNDLQKLLPENIADKLALYCEVKGQHAFFLLALNPLIITKEESKTIDECVKCELVDQLQHRYNQHSQVNFDQLHEQAQTVIASVAFQYGNLAKRCPTFWGFAITQDWAPMLDELRDFGDRYNTRRTKEADYFLSGLIGNGR